MIKYSLKFKNKTKVTENQRKDQSSLKEILFDSSSKENQASEFLRQISEVEQDLPIDFKACTFKEETVSPWISSTIQKSQQNTILKTITNHPENTRYFWNKKDKKKKKAEREPIKIKQKCYSSITNYPQEKSFQGKFLIKKNTTEKKALDSSLKGKFLRKSTSFYDQMTRTQFPERKWELKESNDQFTQLKKKIVDNIEKQSIVSMYKMKKPLKSSENESKPVIRHLRNNRRVRKNILEYSLANPLAKSMLERIFTRDIKK